MPIHFYLILFIQSRIFPPISSIFNESILTNKNSDILKFPIFSFFDTSKLFAFYIKIKLNKKVKHFITKTSPVILLNQKESQH